MTRRWAAATALVLLALGSLTLRGAERAPKLIVILVVDQFRGDYVQRYQQQWTRGLHRLVTTGAYFRQADYPYFNTVTCAGHATISTGAVPSMHGMILNTWWDRASQKVVACTQDDTAKPISYGGPAKYSDSPKWLALPTLGDELRAQLPIPPRIVTFSMKARSAINLAGHRGDAVTWFDDGGALVTSTAFASAPVPWIADFVKRNPVDRDLDKVWERTLSRSAYLYEETATGAIPIGEDSPKFPHRLKNGSGGANQAFYTQWEASPFSDEYLGRIAETAVDALHLGQGPGIDYLGVSFSALDLVGHDFGPRSHEVQDVLVRVDRTIGSLLDHLDRTVGVGNYVVALSADHGTGPTPESATAEGIDAGRMDMPSVQARAEAALARTLGAVAAAPRPANGKYVAHLVFTELYLNEGVYEAMRITPGATDAVLDAIRSAPGVDRAYTRDELRNNSFENDPVGRAAARGYYPSRSGDIVILPKAYWINSTAASTHGSSYVYDTRVPVVLMGKGIKGGEYLQPATPADIAPTLAFLSGVTLARPFGRVLAEALTRPPAGPATPPKRATAPKTDAGAPHR